MANETERQTAAYTAEMQSIAEQRSLVNSLPLFFSLIKTQSRVDFARREAKARSAFPLGYAAYSAGQEAERR